MNKYKITFSRLIGAAVGLLWGLLWGCCCGAVVRLLWGCSGATLEMLCGAAVELCGLLWRCCTTSVYGLTDVSTMQFMVGMTHVADAVQCILPVAVNVFRVLCTVYSCRE